jgi:hypothetical protein
VLLSDVAGWLGAGALLAGYALLSAGRIGARAGYQVLNLAGSIGLAINAVTHRAWPSAAVNAVWLVIALAALGRVAAARKNLEGGVETGSGRSRGR